MLSWDVKDIRRRMPEYRVREGDLVYNAPYRATQADLDVFVLSADPAQLQTLVDTQLNACVTSNAALLGSQTGLRFTSTEPWIVLIYAAFRSLASVDITDSRKGFLGALELSVWVPITKRQLVAGTPVSEPAWFLPLVYTAPTASVITGREVFGYPKVPAYLPVPLQGGPPCAVQPKDFLKEAESSPGDSRTPTRLFELHPPPAPTYGPPAGSLGADSPQLSAAVERFFRNVPLIFHKQVGLLEGEGEQGKALRAGYSALLESRVPISRLSHLEKLSPTTVPQLRLGEAEQSVLRALGISSTQLDGLSVRGCTLDIQQGREIWVASGTASYIPPLDAPGNELLRSSKAFNLPAVPRNVITDEHADVDITINGAAEVYLAKPRAGAVAALLARHFPSDLADLKVDASRPDIQLWIMRASSHAAVHLYEFSVWVPVLHGGQPAFYVPYMFRSPGAAVIHAREWFGHPCQEGFIRFVDGESTRIVELRRPSTQGRNGVEWVRRPGVVFEARARPDALQIDPERDQLHMIGETGVPQSIVGLLQVRHVADTTRACVQEVVSSTRLIDAVVRKEQPLFCKVSLPEHLRLGRLLDLDGPSDVVRGYRLDGLTLISSPSSIQSKV